MSDEGVVVGRGQKEVDTPKWRLLRSKIFLIRPPLREGEPNVIAEGAFFEIILLLGLGVIKSRGTQVKTR